MSGPNDGKPRKAGLMNIGIDVGGTSTRIAWSCPDGNVQVVTRPSASWRRGALLSDPGNATRLLEQIPDAAADLDAPLAVGASGCDTDEQCDTFAGWLSAHRRGPVAAHNDAELFGPAMGLGPAIAVVVGTGSIAVGRDHQGHLTKIGGYGWLLGDPGSAPGLVRQAVIAVAVAHDDGARPGPLALALQEHYGSADPVALAYAFTDDAEVTRWGSLCPIVFQAQDQGDPLAAAVINEGAAALARDVVRLRARGAQGTDVVLGGSVVTRQSSLRDAIVRELGEMAPELNVTVLCREPVEGALALARGLGTHATTRNTEEKPALRSNQ
ncbi:MAG: hypothetical protein FWD59_04215 [Micrococcales bacterium]|nr:hypothetical protein [Micrococcales bacterium]